MKRIYIAGPLFTPSERAFNASVARCLEQCFQTYLPQRDGVLIPGRRINSSRYIALSKRVYQADTHAINSSDLLLAILDGRVVDEGVAFELGYARARGKRCLGLRTDARCLLPWGNNPMIEQALERTFSSIDDLSAWTKNWRK